MSTTHPTTVAVIGAGTIGLSWAALFAGHGLRVRVTDPRPDLAEAVDAALAEASRNWPGRAWTPPASPTGSTWPAMSPTPSATPMWSRRTARRTPPSSGSSSPPWSVKPRPTPSC